MFKAAIKSPATRRQYERYLRRFLVETGIGTYEELLRLGRNSPQKLTEIIIDLIVQYKEKIEKGELSASAIVALYAPVKLFLTMNDVVLNWSKISRTLPRQGKADDRAIEIEEIRKILNFASVRDRALVLLLASSGIRVGAVPDLRVKDLQPIEEDGNILAGKLVVYAKSPEEYYTFITPEAYEATREYLEFRRREGEEITKDSPLFVAAKGDTRALKREATRMVLFTLLKTSGVRRGKNGKRHEFQTNHGFRKFFKTRCEQIMKPIHVEMLMGHSTGISRHYYRPIEREVLEDYRRAIPLLTVSKNIASEGEDLHKEIEELKKAREADKKEIIREVLGMLVGIRDIDDVSGDRVGAFLTSWKEIKGAALKTRGIKEGSPGNYDRVEED